MNTGISAVVFFPIGWANNPDHNIPLIVLVLALGCIGFSLYFKFAQVRLFKHALQVIRGKYDDPEDIGEITSFQALSSALSATVGLGNIAGVAVAISLGGAGAIFWMWVMAFFGMGMKFTECTMAMMYRKVDSKGHVLGGPMVYLSAGFARQYSHRSWHIAGTVLAIVFAIATILGSLGGGNLFQSNQSYQLVANQIPFFERNPLAFGLIIAGLSGAVIIGGIQRIGQLTSALVPAMCGFYCIICLFIIGSNVAQVPQMFASIFSSAFSMEAGFGGFIGILVAGVKRAAFSNEAGLGSSAIAHSAAKTKEPVREGIVAMLEPFIDTLLVCTMTALAILITGAHLNSDVAGIEITAQAFRSVHPSLAVFLTIAAVVFAFSTLVSWSYYGERAAEYLGGSKAVLPFKMVFVGFALVAPIVSLEQAITFSEIMILMLGFPNIIGLIFIAKQIKPLLADYQSRLNTGAMPFLKK